MPCQTVTITATNRSRLNITNVSAVEIDPGVVEVGTAITNSVISGDGQTLTPTLEITVGGERVFNSSLQSIPPNGTINHMTEIQNVQPANNVEVCSTLVGGAV